MVLILKPMDMMTAFKLTGHRFFAFRIHFINKVNPLFIQKMRRSSFLLQYLYFDTLRAEDDLVFNL